MLRKTRVVVSVLTLVAAAGTVLAGNKSWTGAGDNRNWFSGSNWSGGTVPGADDDVTIPNTGQGFVLVDWRVTATVKSLSAQAPVEIAGGTVGVSEAAVFSAGLKMTGGTLTGDGDITIHGDNLWNATALTGTGRFVIAPGASVNCNVAITRSVARPLENHGTLLLSIGAMAMPAGNVLTNAPDGTLRMAANFQLVKLGGVARVENAGEFVASGTSMFVGPTFENSGAVRVEAGTLSLSGGGTHTGQFLVNPGTVMAMRQGHRLWGEGSISGSGDIVIGGVSEFSAGFVPTGAVTVENAAVVTFLGSFNPTRVSIVGSAVATVQAAQVWPRLDLGGTLTGTGDVTLTGADNTLTTGSLLGSGVLNIAQGAALRIYGSHGRSVQRSIHNEGEFRLQGGTATVSGSSFINEPGALFDLDGGQWNELSGGASSVIDNRGQLRVAGISSLTGRISTGLVNRGTVHITGVNVDIMGGGVHTGTVTVAQGARLMLGGGHTFEAGSWLGGDGALTLAGGVQRIDGEFDVRGAMQTLGSGTAQINTTINPASLTISSASTVYMNVPNTPRALLLDSGTLVCNSDVTLGSDAEWRTGTVSGPARLVVPAGATLALTSPVSRSLYGQIWNEGVVSIRQAYLSMSGTARLDNREGARLEMLTNAFISGTGNTPLANHGGVIAFVGNNSTSSISARLDNQGVVSTDGVRVTFSGPVVQFASGVLSGGEWVMRNGGSLAMPASALIRENRGHIRILGEASRMPGLAGLTTQSGVLELRGGQSLAVTPLAAGMFNQGVLVIDADSRLTVAGPFTQGADGTYEPSIAPAGRNGRIESSGRLSLGGALMVSLAEGTSLTCSESYELMAGATVVGEFETIDVPAEANKPTAVQIIGGSVLLDVCPCPADFNRDGGVDGTDVEAFFAVWEEGLRQADVNGDGGVDGTDVERFFQAWEAGGCQ